MHSRGIAYQIKYSTMQSFRSLSFYVMVVLGRDSILRNSKNCWQKNANTGSYNNMGAFDNIHVLYMHCIFAITKTSRPLIVFSLFNFYRLFYPVLFFQALLSWKKRIINSKRSNFRVIIKVMLHCICLQS